ncbi:hypothetical protein CRE_00628 [Caenorhabditis remanei]|uniref:Uncharacterized protein n=1 Tax=Caenorhabditis remanei TaxID=31234 RepID=E3LDJ4_CAERE|nr:hypothetical protein CRE_00628 [Caenorhabditis remanei]
MMSANPKNNCTKMQLRSSGRIKKTPISRCQSVEPNAKLAGNHNRGNRRISAISRKVKNSARGSNIKKETERNLQPTAEELPDDATHDEVPRYDYGEATPEEVLLYGPDPRNIPAMQFKTENNPEFLEYSKCFDQWDQDMATLGGMIQLHQYCYDVYSKYRDPVYRDAADFFKDADPYCIFVTNIHPIRMVYMRIYTCNEVEPWYRDLYSYRDYKSKPFIKDQYDVDKETSFDLLFYRLGRDAWKIMIDVIGDLEAWCTRMFQQENKSEFDTGIDFWSKASPFDFGRNYQLILILTKRKNWKLFVAHKLFKPLYYQQRIASTRRNNVFILRDEEAASLSVYL